MRSYPLWLHPQPKPPLWIAPAPLTTLIRSPWWMLTQPPCETLIAAPK